MVVVGTQEEDLGRENGRRGWEESLEDGTYEQGSGRA